MSGHIEYANGLRQLADWVEAHQDIPPPPDTLVVYELNTKEEAANLLLALKPCRKEYNDEYFYISRKFGPIDYRFCFYRKEVCVRRKVGERVVPAHTEPEKIVPAKVVAEHTEDVYEWDCSKPLLELPSDDEIAAPEQPKSPFTRDEAMEIL